jgi:opacity protein-like surface antigen
MRACRFNKKNLEKKMKKLFLTSFGIMGLCVSGAMAMQVTPYGAMRLSYGWQASDVTVAAYDPTGALMPAAAYPANPSLDTFTTNGAKLALGASTDFGLRGEIEYGVNKTFSGGYSGLVAGGTLLNMANFSIGEQTLLANVYYDLDLDSVFNPYVAAGLGAVNYNVGGTYLGDIVATGGRMLGGMATVSAWSFAWNIGAGVAYQLTDNVAIDLGYRYTDLGNFKMEMPAVQATGPAVSMSKSKIKVQEHEVLLGLRYAF